MKTLLLTSTAIASFTPYSHFILKDSEVSKEAVLVKPKIELTTAPVLVKLPTDPVLVKPQIELPTAPVLVKPKIEYELKPKVKRNIPWENMIDGVKHFEGFRSKSYYCCGGKLTIGYGHTGESVTKGIISEEEARELLEKELHEYKEVVLKIVKVPLTDYQLASLTSFTYNCGRGALYQLVSKQGRLNDGNYDSVEEILPKYRMAKGKIRKGLVKRRAFELSLWNNNIEQ